MSWVHTMWMAGALVALVSGQRTKTEGGHGLLKAGYHLCTVNETRNESAVVVRVVPYIVESHCGGYLPWRMCNITLYKMTTSTEHNEVTREVTSCCHGYVHAGRYCALPLSRAREFTTKPGFCPIAAEDPPEGCETCIWDIDCPGWQKCCQTLNGSRCVNPAMFSSYAVNGGWRLNVTVTVKMDYHHMMTMEKGLVNHIQLLHAMVDGVLNSSDVWVQFLSSFPVDPYRTATSLLIGCNATLSLDNTTANMNKLLRDIAEVSSVTVEDVDECAHPALRNCSLHAECVNTVASYHCTCRHGYRDVLPQYAGAGCIVYTNTTEATPCLGVSASESAPTATQTSADTSAVLPETPTCAPPQLTQLSSSNITGSSFCLSWSTLTPSNTSYKTSYLVDLTNGSEVISHHETNDTKLNVTGLGPGVLYMVTVTPSACESQGESLQLNVKTAAQTLAATARVTNMNFTEDLLNSSSEAYLHFSTSFKEEIYKSLSPELRKLVDSGEVRIEVTSLSPGSVVVNFTVVYDVSYTMLNVSSVLLNSLLNSTKYSVDENSTSVSDFDECTSGLNDCHTNATCINTWASNTCVCNHGFEDMDSDWPGRVCGDTTTSSLVMATTVDNAMPSLASPINIPNTTTTSSMTSTNIPSTTTSSMTFSNIPTTTTSSMTSTNIPSTTTSSMTFSNIPSTTTSSMTFSNIPTTTTSSMTFSNIPSTITSSMTSTIIPTTITSSMTSTIIPTTATSSMTSTIIPTTTTSSMTSTIIPTTTTSSMTSTIIPTTATSSMTSTIIPTTTTSSMTSTIIPTTITSSMTSTIIPTTITSSMTSTIIPTTATSSMTSTIIPTTATSSMTSTIIPTTTTSSMTSTIIPTTTSSITSTIIPTSTTSSISSTNIPSTTTSSMTPTNIPTTTTSSMMATYIPTTTTSSMTSTNVPMSNTSVAMSSTESAVQPTRDMSTFYKVLSAISVECSLMTIMVTIAKDVLQTSQISVLSIYLGPKSNGPHTLNETHVRLTVGLTDTKLQSNETYYTAQVPLFLPRPEPWANGVGDLQVPIICRYRKSTLTSTDFGDKGYNIDIDPILASGSFSVNMELLTGTFLLPNNYTLPPDKDVVVRVSINTTMNEMKLVISKCWATSTLNPWDRISYIFLNWGCPQPESFTAIVSNGNSSSSALSVRIFSFIQLDMVYLHCQVEICVETGLETCIPDCSERTARLAKAVGSAMSSSGALLRSFVGESLDEGIDILHVVGFSVLGIAMGFIFLGSLGCFVFYQRNRIGHYNFNIKPKQDDFSFNA